MAITLRVERRGWQLRPSIVRVGDGSEVQFWRDASDELRVPISASSRHMGTEDPDILVTCFSSGLHLKVPCGVAVSDVRADKSFTNTGCWRVGGLGLFQDPH